MGLSSFAQNEFQVAHFGALKNFMHKNDLSAKADLRAFSSKPHLYALGALENLKGEILILDGQAHVSYELDGQLIIDSSFEHQASLLVASKVSGWVELDIPKKVNSKTELEQFVAEKAKQIGIDVEKPFPFMLKGKLRSASWHVINWPEGDSQHSHEKHKNSGPHGTTENEMVEVLGFYSAHHHAVFTHHTTNMHMHVLIPAQNISGHLDDLVIKQGVKLLLPEHKKRRCCRIMWDLPTYWLVISLDPNK